jgi:hypothetical protein
MAPTSVWIPLVVVLVLAGSSLWVYRDATSRVDRRDPVTFTVGTVEVAMPAAWAAGRLCLWPFFMPLYLTCRDRSR